MKKQHSYAASTVDTGLQSKFCPVGVIRIISSHYGISGARSTRRAGSARSGPNVRTLMLVQRCGFVVGTACTSLFYSNCHNIR